MRANNRKTRSLLIPALEGQLVKWTSYMCCLEILSFLGTVCVSHTLQRSGCELQTEQGSLRWTAGMACGALLRPLTMTEIPCHLTTREGHVESSGTLLPQASRLSRRPEPPTKRCPVLCSSPNHGSSSSKPMTFHSPQSSR